MLRTGRGEPAIGTLNLLRPSFRNLLLAAVSVGGLSTSTLLTLIVVSVAYTLVDDAQLALMRVGRVGNWARVAVAGKNPEPQSGSKASA